MSAKIWVLGLALTTVAVSGCQKARMQTRPKKVQPAAPSVVPAAPVPSRVGSQQLPPLPPTRGTGPAAPSSPSPDGPIPIPAAAGPITTSSSRPVFGNSPVNSPPQDAPAPEAAPNIENIEPAVAVKPLPAALPEKPRGAPGPTQVMRAPAPSPSGATCIDRENRPCPPMPGKCEAISLAAEKELKALDVLFVVDTSTSLRGGLSYQKKKGKTVAVNDPQKGELVQIAREITNFVRRLDPKTDYNIAVLLGHGPPSQYYGRLFSSDERQDPAVIEFRAFYDQEKKRGGSEKEIRTRVEERITKVLEQKMLSIPKDPSEAQGEALLMSLYMAIADPDSLKAIKNARFFRDDAALAVILISDEQDVCYDYMANQTPRRPFQRGGKTLNEDPHEVTFFNDKKNGCAGVVNGERLTPNHVFDALNWLKNSKSKGRQQSKLITIAIVYTSNDIPQGVEDENEMGHGLIELVQLAGGQIADLAKVDRSNNRVSFANELKFLGDYTHFELKYDSSFECKSSVHPIAVNPSTLRVRVLDSTGKVVASFVSPECTPDTLSPEFSNAPDTACREAHGHITPKIMEVGGLKGKPYLMVEVPNAILRKKMEEQRVTAGTVEIKFFTRPEIEPQTGNKR
ncbi:MAG: hypothetical protein AB7P49_04270 [Bdellovibrionales bacterium]